MVGIFYSRELFASLSIDAHGEGAYSVGRQFRPDSSDNRGAMTFDKKVGMFQHCGVIKMAKRR